MRQLLQIFCECQGLDAEPGGEKRCLVVVLTVLSARYSPPRLVTRAFVTPVLTAQRVVVRDYLD